MQHDLLLFQSKHVKTTDFNPLFLELGPAPPEYQNGPCEYFFAIQQRWTKMNLLSRHHQKHETLGEASRHLTLGITGIHWATTGQPGRSGQAEAASTACSPSDSEGSEGSKLSRDYWDYNDFNIF